MLVAGDMGPDNIVLLIQEVCVTVCVCVCVHCVLCVVLALMVYHVPCCHNRPCRCVVHSCVHDSVVNKSSCSSLCLDAEV